MKESHLRSLVKSVSWRLSGTLATGAIVYFVTGRWDFAVAIGVAEGISKIGIFYFHERIWERISFGRQETRPQVFWLTGLSGAGKSTIAESLVQKLRAQGHRVEHLDGDNLREIFPNTGFTKEERDQHVRRVGYLASRLE
ncbi:MAG: adenylyl-sulfate kinase, partial [Bdellovibrionales bacterium]|nr:adenylyl-sulfate kinase [Bdellovibrionales bacterium]